MAWITITEADILTGNNAPSVAAARTAALKDGQTDPLPMVIAQVTTSVRGSVAACAKNVLGPEGTIPDELIAEAIDMVMYRLCKRVGPTLLKQLVIDANADALAKMREVAACRVALVPPAIEAPPSEQAAGSAASLVSSGRRVASRRKLNGL